MLRIEPVRKKRDEGEVECSTVQCSTVQYYVQVECVAENAHGDPVTARAALKIYDGECWAGQIITVFTQICTFLWLKT